MNKMVEIGDSEKSKYVCKSDMLVNSNTKGGPALDGDAKRFTLNKMNSYDEDEGEKEDKDDYSNRSDDDSLKYKEVDRFGFIGGNQYTDPQLGSSSVPIEILRLRELKWLDMMENWDKWMLKRFKKVKERCRKGIPDSLRARAWQRLTGSAVALADNDGRYQVYLSSPGNPTCLEEIRKDVSRQYPNHELFMEDNGQGQEDLYSVLMAYSIHDPSVGYCQAQGPLAAVLLTVMPAEQAFWAFQTVCEKYLPGYYEAGLEAVQIDSMVLFGLLKKASPIAYKHLKKQKVEPILWMTDWFMCLYSRTLPWPSVLRVWDMFLCEGIKVVFRVALVLVKGVLGTAEQVERCPTFYETLDRLRKIPTECMEENHLVREMAKLPITERDIEREHERQLKKWNAAKNEKIQKKNGSSAPAPTPAPVPVEKTTSNRKPESISAPNDPQDPATKESTSNDASSAVVDRSEQNGKMEPNAEDSCDARVPPTAILPPPGSLLLPKAMNRLPSSRQLIPVPESALPASALPKKANPEANGMADRSKAERASKRFPFLSRRAEGRRDSSESSAVGRGEAFVRFKPSPSPCSSLSAVPQIRPDEKRRTFRSFWSRGEDSASRSKSTTQVDR